MKEILLLKGEVLEVVLDILNVSLHAVEVGRYSVELLRLEEAPTSPVGLTLPYDIHPLDHSFHVLRVPALPIHLRCHYLYIHHGFLTYLQSLSFCSQEAVPLLHQELP